MPNITTTATGWIRTPAGEPGRPVFGIVPGMRNAGAEVIAVVPDLTSMRQEFRYIVTAERSDTTHPEFVTWRAGVDPTSGRPTFWAGNYFPGGITRRATDNARKSALADMASRAGIITESE